MLRFLFTILLFYLAWRVVSQLFAGVVGRGARSEPLQGGSDGREDRARKIEPIEDARWREVSEEASPPDRPARPEN